MMTLGEFSGITDKVSAYRGARDKLERYTHICGGYLHYNSGYTATIMGESTIVKRALVDHQARIVHRAIDDLELAGVDMSKERDEAYEIVKASQENANAG